MSVAVFDIGKFRAMFPEFGDVTKYPDAQLTMMWDMACEFVSEQACPCAMLEGKQREYVLYLLVAHMLSIFAQQQANAAAGKLPGSAPGGIETSASIGDISVGRMAPPARDGWEFWLAQTPYGQQIWALLGIIAVGGFTVGGLPERRGFRKINGTFM